MMIVKICLSLCMILLIYVVMRFLLSSTENVELPSYQILTQDSPYEVRAYDAMIIAYTDASGDQKKALRPGFHHLAAYIFGNNQAKQKISMTAPVLEKEQDNDWRIAFIMPAHYELSELPSANDKLVHIERMPARKYVVLRFSGWLSTGILQEKKMQFQRYLHQKSCKVIDEPLYAFYNPPWTLPFLRRHEIWYPLDGECHLKNDKVSDGRHHESVASKDHHKKYH